MKRESKQTGSSRGDFMMGDRHPNDKELVFARYRKDRKGVYREYWVTPDRLQEIKESMAKHSENYLNKLGKSTRASTVITVTCKACRQEFDTYNTNRVYCSPECRPESFRKKSAGKIIGLGTTYWDDDAP